MASAAQSTESAQADGRRLELNVTSAPANLAVVRLACEKFCAQHGLPREAVDEVGLCVNEAMANVTRHAYGGKTDRPVRVLAQAVDCGVEIRIRDWGNGVNPETLPAKSVDPLTPGGLGLVCLRRLMDEARFEPQPDGMLLILRKCCDHRSAECDGDKEASR